MRSVLLHRTYGRTYWTGINRTVSPRARHRRPPIVRGAARLHHDRRPRGEAVEKGFELPSREALPVNDPVRPIGHGHLEDVLC